MFQRLKFKLYLWVLSWDFVDNHIKSVDSRAANRGLAQGKILALQTVADRLSLQWPPLPGIEFYKRLKWLWLHNPRMVMYKFPLSPVENEDGRLIGFAYDIAQDLDSLRWVLAEMWLVENKGE